MPSLPAELEEKCQNWEECIEAELAEGNKNEWEKFVLDCYDVRVHFNTVELLLSVENVKVFLKKSEIMFKKYFVLNVLRIFGPF